MEYENKENINYSNFDERFEEIKKSKLKPVFEKLEIKDEDYEIIGKGTYGMVIKLKGNDDFAWKFTYVTIKNTENLYNQNECFKPEETSLLLKDKKIDNVCEILDVIDFGLKSWHCKRRIEMIKRKNGK